MDDTTDDTSSTGTGTTTTACYGRWTREASRNPILAAAEIYFMACPRDRVPWRQLLRMSRGRGGTSPEDLFARPPPPPERWAGRRTRRRRTGPEAAAASAADEDSAAAVAVAVATKERRRMDSPTTPLSWTTTAASSGSGSRSGASEVAARDDDAVTTAAAAGSGSAAAAATATATATATVVLPVFGKKRPRRSEAEPTAFTVPSSAGFPAPPTACPAVSSLSDVLAAAATSTTGNSRSVLGLTDATANGTTTDGAVATGSGGGGGGGGVGYASVSRTTRLLLGKKMTLVELKCYEQSLLQQNIDMRKELELQRKAQKVLVEENARLKMLKSKHQPQAARQLFVVAKDVVSSAKCPFLPFDLNMPAAEDAVDPSGEGFH